MNKTVFDRLYRWIQASDTDNLDPERLSGRLVFYRHLYDLVSICPWLSDEYGSRTRLGQHIADTIGTAIRQQSASQSEPDRIRLLNTLLESSDLTPDRQYEETLLTTACATLDRIVPFSTVDPDIAPLYGRLACNLFYWIEEEEYSALARSLIQDSLGDFERPIETGQALEHLYTLAAYRLWVSDDRFAPVERAQTDRYLKPLSSSSSVPVETDIQALSLLSLTERTTERATLVATIADRLEQRLTSRIGTSPSGTDLKAVGMSAICLLQELDSKENNKYQSQLS